MFKLSPWNIMCIIIFLFGAINGDSSWMAVGLLMFIIGFILKLIMKVD